jgi:signal transduction histidine kinase
MNLQKRLTLHYIIVVVVVMLFSYGASSFIILLLSGFDFNIYGIKISWSGFLDDSILLTSFFLTFPAFFFVISFLYGRKMSSPLFYFLNWIDQLSQGNYNVPEVSETRRNKIPSIFDELSIKINNLTDRLKENEIERKKLEEMRREWTSGVTHDLKTPLSYIQGYATILLSDEHQWTLEDQKKFITIIQEKANHIHHLIEDLSDTFRFESNTVQPKLKQLDIVSFVEKVMIDVSQQPAARSKQYRFVANEETIFYQFDEELIKRALVNLLMNAVLHNPPNTTITVTVQKNMNLSITISDNGSGMNEEEKNNLFQRYYRGTSTSTPIAGTGLGMAIAERFITAHQGTIDVQSSIGKGTTIVIHLPKQN